MGFGWKNEECRPPKKVSPGVTDFTKNNIDRVFKEIKNFKYDLVISYIHAGYEFEYYPLPLHVELSRYLVDMGSDIVYQSHTHCIQPYEIYKSNYIFYGLGNFYFSSLRDRFPNISDKGIMVEIILHDNCKYDVNILDIVYNRIKKISSVSTQSNFLETHRLTYESSKIYSKNYKKIRTRKKNPRPIMHYNRHVSNEIKYRLWLAIVKITGVLKIRRIIKIILGWQ